MINYFVMGVQSLVQKFKYGIFLIIFFIILFFGGLGLGLFEYFPFYAILTFLLFIIFSLISELGNIKIPKIFFTYSLFLIIMTAQLFFVSNKVYQFEILTLFVSGGLLWILYYNFGKEGKLIVDKSIIYLSITFFILFVINFIIHNRESRALSLVLPANIKLSHYHIGDFIVLPLLYLFRNLFKKPKNHLHYFLIFICLATLWLSHSRSAALSLIIAYIYYLYKANKQFFDSSKFKQYSGFLIFILVILFLVLGLGKSTLTDRPYLMQGISGFIKYPFGVGMGKFRLISNTFAPPLADDYAVLTDFGHNLFLELFSGMGVLGVVFLIWVLQIFKELFWSKTAHNNIFYKSLFLALFVNFMFDITYFIPTMFLLWFSFLGLAMNEDV